MQIIMNCAVHHFSPYSRFMESGIAKFPAVSKVTKLQSSAATVRLTLVPCVHVPLRAVVQIISVPDEDLLPRPDIVQRAETRHQPEPGHRVDTE